MQIRTRLTIQFILLVAGILLLSMCFIYVKFRTITEDEFYDGLRSKALMTAEMLLHDEDKLKPLEKENDENGESTLPFRENVIIYDAHFQKIFAFNRAAPPLPEKILQRLKSGQEMRFLHGKLHAIGLLHRSKSMQEYFLVAESVFDPEDLVNLRNILIGTFILCTGIVAAGGWFYAGQAMSPVARIVNQVDGILPSDLSARLDAPNNHDEISRLVKTFNRMLERIQFAFRMQKSFISNVSHELKNPISVIIAQLEVTLQKSRGPKEYCEVMGSVLDDAKQLNEVAEKLLQLARLHSEGADIAFEYVRLDEIMLQTRSSLLRMHPDYHISFDIEGIPEDEKQLCVLGNEPLLRSAFQNLMDNGCKFSPDKKVDVKIYFDPTGRHHVEIIDWGPGIPQKELQLIFQPFYRSSQNVQVRGSGIGLSLVDSILKLHHVALEIASSEGVGTTFRLSFPGI